MDKSGRIEAARILEELVAVEAPRERGELLERRCGADEDLRARVRALILALGEPVGLEEVPRTAEEAVLPRLLAARVV